MRGNSPERRLVFLAARPFEYYRTFGNVRANSGIDAGFFGAGISLRQTFYFGRGANFYFLRRIPIYFFACAEGKIFSPNFDFDLLRDNLRHGNFFDFQIQNGDEERCSCRHCRHESLLGERIFRRLRFQTGNCLRNFCRNNFRYRRRQVVEKNFLRREIPGAVEKF